MYSSFQSEQGKVLEVIIKDSAGTVVDTTLDTIHDIEVIVCSKLDGSIMEKFSREEKENFTQAEATAEHLLCHISNMNITAGGLECQVNIIIPNEKSATGYSVFTQKGIIANLIEAHV